MLVKCNWRNFNQIGLLYQLQQPVKVCWNVSLKLKLLSASYVIYYILWNAIFCCISISRFSDVENSLGIWWLFQLHIKIKAVTLVVIGSCKNLHVFNFASLLKLWKCDARELYMFYSLVVVLTLSWWYCAWYFSNCYHSTTLNWQRYISENNFLEMSSYDKTYNLIDGIFV